MNPMTKVIEELDVGEETARLEKGATSLLGEKSLGLSSEKKNSFFFNKQRRKRKGS